MSTFCPSLRPGTPGMTAQVEVLPIVVDVVLLGQKERRGSFPLPYHDEDGLNESLPTSFEDVRSW